ncbi:nuclear transport factor 2 family protein [Marinobacterium rhizophilum]|uniref:Nuclear transport factor 2 family protein n=1 Tax=Marinobacterium rhizophilum TaxID=420402 RepID=A0ABY5HF00_9GAMM|nr:nuclear transport factor 2 family protein [Marinobacterium rhizophilum]UTW10932.1 nuclear transport factor 2 family protein [Marinobacterium rhizophilum]
MENTAYTGDFGSKEFDSVMTLVRDYFDGLHYGEVSKLRAIFHPDAFLKAPGLRRSLDQWLDAVASRPVPDQQGRPYDFKLLSIEIIKDQAMVKLECPLFEHFYVDFLGLLKENGRWLVVNKMYSDLQEDVP